MIDKNKIIMEAFLDELSKTASVDKHALYGALARLGGSLVARLGGRGASMATRRGMVWARRRATSAKNISKTLAGSQKGMAAGKPGILKRPFMKARENLATLVKSPKEFGKRIMHDIRYKTVDPSKIVGGKIKNNPLRRIATGQTHRNVQQLGFRNGQAVIKRTAAGQLGQAAMGAGVGMGAIDFATNSTDEQGNKRGLGNRLVRATGEAAKWTIAPGLAMGWEVGSLGAGMLKTKQKNSFEQRARIATQKTWNNNINY